MGEAVVSSEGGMGLEEVQETEMTELKKITGEGGGSGGAAAAEDISSAAVRWERFRPKMVMRVLLVEADDSTRQIIAALLRKCSYRVAAVPDGLKAWEILKGRPHNIDLILTEVELPSISGYALLTLIMEHQVCKNIPVIMMSSQDSVSTVYKCMLRGATDFLVKPLRKNELRNLWQHVWRKQSSSIAAGLGPPDENGAQQKEEATAENKDITNHLSGYMSCIQRNRECIEKGSDAQSSCSKPELETKEEDTKHIHCLSQPKSATHLSDDDNIPMQEECHQESRNTQAHDSETGGLRAVANPHADLEITPHDDGWEQANSIGLNVETDHVLENSSKEAIDLIGAFDNHLRGTFESSTTKVSTDKFDLSPLLDLSLRRSHLEEAQVNEETPRLNHSDASAFSRYIHKPLHLHMPTCNNQQKDHETNSEKLPSSNHIHTPDYNSDTHGPNMSSQKHVSTTSIQTGQPEIINSYSHHREISHPTPIRGLPFERNVNAYGSIYRTKSGSSPLSSPGTAHHSESFLQLNQFCPSGHRTSNSQNLVDPKISNSIDQTEDNKLENLDDEGHVLPGNDQSTNSSSYCNGNISHHQSTDYGSNGKISAISAIKAASECCNEESMSVHVHEGASHRSTLREAALNKFRLKRKDRCFEKKVRYESRKKLAEQRPRVKGQFVRQVPNDPQPSNSIAGYS